MLVWFFGSVRYIDSFFNVNPVGFFRFSFVGFVFENNILDIFLS